MEHKKVFLASPSGDKGYALHIFHYLNNDSQLIYYAQKLNKKYDAHIFFQGRTNDWLMIEFWTKDHNAILNFCVDFAEHFNAELSLDKATLRDLDIQRTLWKQKGAD